MMFISTLLCYKVNLSKSETCLFSEPSFPQNVLTGVVSGLDSLLAVIARADPIRLLSAECQRPNCFEEGAASTDAGPCANLFFKSVWCMSTPGASIKCCQILNNQRLLGKLLASLWKNSDLLYIVRILDPSWYSNISLLPGRKADAGTQGVKCHTGISARLSAPQ